MSRTPTTPTAPPALDDLLRVASEAHVVAVLGRSGVMAVNPDRVAEEARDAAGVVGDTLSAVLRHLRDRGFLSESAGGLLAEVEARDAARQAAWAEACKDW